MKTNFSFYLLIFATIVYGCKKETKEPEKSQCEISNVGTLIIKNQSSTTITVKIDGGIPSNMGYMAPGDEKSVEVTAGINHHIHAYCTSGSSLNGTWDIDSSVGTCQTISHILTL